VPPASRADGDAVLAHRTTGRGPRLVLVHGFTQNARAWGPFADLLAAHHQVVAVDLPGHGGSDGVVASLPEAADLVAAVGAAGGGRDDRIGHEVRADYLGYSLGGRVALHLALSRPASVRRLVVVGATAGIEDPDERARRRRDDDAAADRLERAARDIGCDAALDAFLHRWLSQPLFATLTPVQAELDARLGNTVAGLASSLRTCGTGTQAPLWDRLRDLAMPVLVVAGALDERYAPIARRMAQAIGANAQVALVPGAGHACHLERPAYTARLVESFLGDPHLGDP